MSERKTNPNRIYLGCPEKDIEPLEPVHFYPEAEPKPSKISPPRNPGCRFSSLAIAICEMLSKFGNATKKLDYKKRSHHTIM